MDLYVPALIEGVYGNRRWMAQLGKKGGKARTEAKRLAARANGVKGGNQQEPQPSTPDSALHIPRIHQRQRDVLEVPDVSRSEGRMRGEHDSCNHGVARVNRTASPAAVGA